MHFAFFILIFFVSSTVEQVKARLGIVEVVGSYLKLEKAGANYKACCPFHNEKTPSFFVSPARENYHCFGCGKGGDIFSFVEEMEGVDFIQALKSLAEKAGVPMDSRENKNRGEKEIIYEILATAVLFFEKRLRENADVENYLKERGLTQETIKKFRLGYAPDGWRNLHHFLTQRSFKEMDIEKAGLIIRGGHGYYDRFRSRVMFPLCDAQGRVIAFSGRIFGEKQDGAKYVNSPQTILYDKSQVLYGLDKAKVEVRRKDVCILVEGQMDLVLSHQAGLSNSVALSGTALTDQHIKSIKRLTPNIIMAFDSDKAGFSASRRSLALILENNMEARVVLLPLGLDPADLASREPEKWREMVSKPKHVINFYLDLIDLQASDQRGKALLIEREILPLIVKLASRIDQAYFVSLAASKAGLKEEIIWQALGALHSGKSIHKIDQAKQQSGPSRREAIERRLFSHIYWKESPLRAMLEALLGEEYVNGRLQSLTTDKERLIWEADYYFNNSAKEEKELKHLISNLEEHLLKEKLSAIMEKLRQKTASDEKGEKELLEEYQQLSAKLASVRETFLNYEKK